MKNDLLSFLHASTLRRVGVILGVLFLWTSIAEAQTPSYYVDGSATNTYNIYPLGTTSSRKTQNNYLANEFTGAYAGNITTVWLKRGNSTSGTTYSNLTVKMAQIASSTFPSTTTFHSPMTTVYTAASTYIPSGSADVWFSIQLQSPFPYNPNQALIVQICQDSYTGSGIGLRFAYQTSPPYRRIWGSSCSATSGTSTDNSRYSFGFDMSPALPDDAGISKLINPNPCAGNYNVDVELFNYGTNTLNSVTINWTWNNQLQTPVNFTTPLPSLGTANVTLGTKMLTGSTPNSLVVWTSNPNNTTDSFPGNDTLWATIQPSLSGTYTIGGASPDYATFAAAANDLNAYGVCGPVVFNVRSGTYNERVALQAIPGASAVNTITFQSETGNRPDVTLTNTSSSTANNGVVDLGAAKFVSFRNMTIQNLANGTYCAAVVLGSSTDCTFEGCELIAGNTTYTGYYAAVIHGYGAANDRTTIRDCGLRNGSAGAYLYSGAQDFTIENCEFTGQYYYRVYGYYLVRFKFHDNYVEQKPGGYTYAYYLVQLYYPEDYSIERNRFIVDDDAYYRYGVYIYSYSNQGTNNRLVNNFFYTNHNQASYYGIGLYMYYGTNVLVAHNTFYMNSTNLNTRSVMQYYGANQQWYNNIFYSAGQSITNWMYTPSAITASDYNVYYSTATPMGVWGSSSPANDFDNIAELQAASGMEKNSISKTISFKNPLMGDLHLTSPSEDDTDLFGTLLPQVTDDIDHEKRIQPYRGADEACYIEPGSVTYDFVDQGGQPAAYVEAPGTIGVHYRVAFPEFAATIQMTVSFFNVQNNQLVYQTVLTAQKQYGVTLDDVQYITIPATVPAGAYKVEVNFWTKNSCGEYRDYMPYPSALLVVPEGRIPCVVWPGDVNNDGVVSYADRRGLNRYIYDANLRTSWLNGPPRYQADQEQNPFTYLEWKPQAAAPWYTPDGCYMDTDGNGVINNLDYIAMKLNWSKMTPWYGGSPKTDVSAVSSFSMDQNYPNPFNPATMIRYHVPEASHVRLVVTDALGRQVSELLNGQVDAGMHEVQFDGSSLSSGTYIATITISGTESGMTYNKAIKMVLGK